MTQTVIGIFENASQAQNAVAQLVSNGFTRANIDVAARNEDVNTTSTSSYDDNDGFGDSISKFFGSLFDSNDEVNNYSSVAKRGSVVTVHADSAIEAERAASILDQYGAVDVNERAAQYRNTAASSTTDSSAPIPIIEEELQVGKRVVETGGVRLRSRIIERPVEETLRLRVEHVHVERNTVNRPVSEADLANFQEGTIEVTERAEIPVVGKTARVVEEVRLEKDVEEREETIRDTVRRTDVDVENIKTDEERSRPGSL